MSYSFLLFPFDSMEFNYYFQNNQKIKINIKTILKCCMS